MNWVPFLNEGVSSLLTPGVLIVKKKETIK